MRFRFGTNSKVETSRAHFHSKLQMRGGVMGAEGGEENERTNDGVGGTLCEVVTAPAAAESTTVASPEAAAIAATAAAETAAIASPESATSATSERHSINLEGRGSRIYE